MAKTKGVRYWKGKAWDEFSKYIRVRDALRTTGKDDLVVCCTCGKTYPAFGKGCAQAGHFIPGRGNSILFDERGVHAQCYNCNHTLKGNWTEYLPYMKRRYGQDVVDELLAVKYRVRKFTPAELEKMRDDYKAKWQVLKGGSNSLGEQG